MVVKSFLGTIRLTLVPVLVVALVGCSSTDIDPAAGAGDDRTAAVYGTILEWLILGEPGVDGAEQADWVLFVATRSTEVIDIDIQAVVVAALDPVVKVRFIDDWAEAVDGEHETEPVRDLGLLVGLGAVTPEGDTVEVYADRYRNTEQVEAWQFTVSRVGGFWELTGTPEIIDVRPIPLGT